MAASAQPGTPASADAAEANAAQARRSLARIIQTYGLQICADPWRCEALLRDLCPGCRREVFWLIAALKENVVADLKRGLESTAEPLLLARVAHKLADNLGFADGPAEWTAQSWLLAVRAAPVSAAAPELTQVTRVEFPAWPAPGEASALAALPPGVDARWLALCLAGVALAALPLAALARVLLVTAAPGPRAWAINTVILAAALALALLGEYGLARATEAWPPRRRPSPAQTPLALLPELLLLLAGPLVLIAGPLAWFGDWYLRWRIFGAQLDFAFHLGRLVQSLLLAGFLVKWTAWMTRVQGRVASTLVRPR